MAEQVQLIAYADRLGGSLAGLGALLDGPLAGLFGGVHVLPFYTPYDGADAGFDPVDHLTVDPRLGTWADLESLGRSRDVVADLIVNHVSDRSPQVVDLVERGQRSPYAEMVLTYDKVFPGGATEADLLRIVRPRPGLPFTPLALGGHPRLVWTTFTAHQVDLDVHSPAAWAYLTSVLQRLAGCGVAMVRLDAVGYAVKTAGTSCFMTAETMDFIAAITAEARALGLQVLTEIHAHHRHTVATAARVDRVYDFVLAPLVLHAVFTGETDRLRSWLAQRPANAVTVLDTHDGIGMIDGAGPGLLSAGEIDTLVTAIARNSGGTSRASRPQGGAVYQVSSTLYDAVGADDRRYLLARLLQLLVPGIPQVYYVGLLAGRNDPTAAGDAREINRRRYTAAEVSEALARPVVRALSRLIRFRNAHPAFGGDFALLDAGPGELALGWQAGAARVELVTRPTDATYRLAFTTDDGKRTVTDVADLPGGERGMRALPS